MVQHTCPLCGEKMSTLRIEHHRIPKKRWFVNFVTQLTYSSIIGYTFYPHLWRMNNESAYLYGCTNCGYVRVIKEGDE